MPVLPDLKPWVDESKGYLHGWTVQGDEIRITTAVHNAGDGALELRGGAVNGDTQEVYQRIFEADGTYSDVLAGEFIFHPEHAHIHFEGFAQFQLREVTADGGVGAVVAAGDKVSFCLLDVDQYDPSAGPATYNSCGQIQGISAGWSDVYHRGLPGQSIDITGVGDGTYWLEMVVDPDNLLVEADETNNVERIQINLVRSDGPGGIAQDTFEPDNGLDQASLLAPPEDHLYEGLTIHEAGNDDFFEVLASETGDLTFEIAFSHAAGDLDMEVYNSQYILLARSDSVSDLESLTVSGQQGETYFVRVYGFNGATSPDYSLFVNQATPQGPDRFESNDTVETATPLISHIDAVYSDINLHSSTDVDYFRVSAAENKLIIHLDFVHADGNINAAIYDMAGTLIVESTRDASHPNPNHEHLEFDSIPDTEYVLMVYGEAGATNPSYSVTVEHGDHIHPPPDGSDTFEPNDSFATAAVLAAPIDTSFTNLSIHEAGNDDYYRITASETGDLVLTVSFDHAAGDIDMIAYGATQNWLGISETTTDTEQITISAVAGEDYYLRVFGYSGATNEAYTLSVDQPDAPPPPPLGDAYEPNDSFAAAALLDAPTDSSFENLSIHVSGNEDYFRVVASETGTLTFRADFDHAQGDLDMIVYGPAQNWLGISETTTNSEQVTISAVAGDDYFVRVFGYNGATNPTYSLTVDQPEPPVPPSLDAFEPNDSFATAVGLDGSTDSLLQNLSIHAAGNDDYFSVTPENAGLLTFGIDFDHAAGDLDIELLDAAQNRLALSETVTNAEQVTIDAIAGETYVLRVYGYNDAVSADYDLTLDVPEADVVPPVSDPPDPLLV